MQLENNKVITTPVFTALIIISIYYLYSIIQELNSKLQSLYADVKKLESEIHDMYLIFYGFNQLVEKMEKEITSVKRDNI